MLVSEMTYIQDKVWLKTDPLFAKKKSVVVPPNWAGRFFALRSFFFLSVNSTSFDLERLKIKLALLL